MFPLEEGFGGNVVPRWFLLPAVRPLASFFAPDSTAARAGAPFKNEEGTEALIQIKGRSYAGTAVENGQRIGKLDFTKKWDRIVLVLLDEQYEVKEIIEVSRAK